MAILLAWEKHTSEDEEKYSNIIERIKMDSIEQVIYFISYFIV